MNSILKSNFVQVETRCEKGLFPEGGAVSHMFCVLSQSCSAVLERRLVFLLLFLCRRQLSRGGGGASGSDPDLTREGTDPCNNTWNTWLVATSVCSSGLFCNSAPFLFHHRTLFSHTHSDTHTQTHTLRESDTHIVSQPSLSSQSLVKLVSGWELNSQRRLRKPSPTISCWFAV